MPNWALRSVLIAATHTDVNEWNVYVGIESSCTVYLICEILLHYDNILLDEADSRIHILTYFLSLIILGFVELTIRVESGWTAIVWSRTAVTGGGGLSARCHLVCRVVVIFVPVFIRQRTIVIRRPLNTALRPYSITYFTHCYQTLQAGNARHLSTWGSPGQLPPNLFFASKSNKHHLSLYDMHSNVTMFPQKCSLVLMRACVLADLACNAISSRLRV